SSTWWPRRNSAPLHALPRPPAARNAGGTFFAPGNHWRSPRGPELMFRHVRRVSSGNRMMLAVAFAFGASMSTEADERSRSGEQVYKETCSACHATGVANAPKLGDRNDWAPLIAEGQHVLTAHAWVGVRGMPPRGGR